MSKYGIMIENFEENQEIEFNILKKKELYNHFVKYFNNPILTKIKDIDGYSMYMAKTYCLLSNHCRYIITFVKEDNFPLKTEKTLNNIDWISLQTRTLEDKHDLKSHTYNPYRYEPLMKFIKRIELNKNESVYVCEELGLNIFLLHVKNDVQTEYQNQGNLIAALETYQTIINFR